MRFGLREELLQNIIDEFSKWRDIKRVVIFGSRARGTFRYNSDIDIAVYAEGKLPAGLYLNIEEVAGVYKIDIIDMQELENQVLERRIEEEGICIYEACG